jgi:hypothetical protein
MTYPNPFESAYVSPEPEHTACPFWDGDVQPDEMVRQIGLMFDQGIRSFVIHARVGRHRDRLVLQENRRLEHERVARFESRAS